MTVRHSDLWQHAVMDVELLALQQSWAGPMIDGAPSITEGTLTVSTQGDRGFLLGLSTGDERNSHGEHLEYPISTAQAQLLIRALQGEVVGVFGN